ncbi:hypothetical protein FQR65_LT10030 [Abscondita terminalis]|nr:hypothetical protein FQR65_LT10030 [Abscondita terminalis]
MMKRIRKLMRDCTDSEQDHDPCSETEVDSEDQEQFVEKHRAAWTIPSKTAAWKNRFIEIIRKQKIEKEWLLVSFDVVSLFTNVSIDEAILFINQQYGIGDDVWN